MKTCHLEQRYSHLDVTELVAEAGLELVKKEGNHRTDGKAAPAVRTVRKVFAQGRKPVVVGLRVHICYRGKWIGKAVEELLGRPVDSE